MLCFNCHRIYQGEIRLSTLKSPQLITHHVSMKEFHDAVLQSCYICVLLWHDFIQNDQESTFSSASQNSNITSCIISESDQWSYRVSEGSYLLVFYFNIDNDTISLQSKVGGLKEFVVKPLDGKHFQHLLFYIHAFRGDVLIRSTRFPKFARDKSKYGL